MFCLLALFELVLLISVVVGGEELPPRLRPVAEAVLAVVEVSDVDLACTERLARAVLVEGLNLIAGEVSNSKAADQHQPLRYILSIPLPIAAVLGVLVVVVILVLVEIFIDEITFNMEYTSLKAAVRLRHCCAWCHSCRRIKGKGNS
jgi:hypothetical protein